MNLPNLSIIKRWLKNSKCKPGFISGIFKYLKNKANIMCEEECYYRHNFWQDENKKKLFKVFKMFKCSWRI